MRGVGSKKRYEEAKTTVAKLEEQLDTLKKGYITHSYCKKVAKQKIVVVSEVHLSLQNTSQRDSHST